MPGPARDGRVKLLDFGVAKLSEQEPRAESQTHTVDETRPGEIRGTAGYMSPEQVLGAPVDHRTDIFALGAMLYEMFTGARAFHRPTSVQTMTAVLQDDPADPCTVNPRLPPAAAALVLRCLEKNKEERFQSARDLAFALQQLRDSTATTSALEAPSVVRRRTDAALIWFTAGAVRSGRALRAVTLEKRPRLVFETPGSLTLWDIAPDGRVLLTRDEERRAIVGVAPGSPTERDMSWLDQSGVADLSPDGRWLLGRDRFGVYVQNTDGSAPKSLDLKEGFADAISPDGKTAIGTDAKGLVLIPTGVGEPRRLPPHGITRWGGARWFPDGKRILFTGAPGDKSVRSYVQDASGGAPQALTPEGIRGLAISMDSKQIAAVGGTDPTISIWSDTGVLQQRVKGSLADDRPVAFSADGRSLWLFRRGEVPAHVYKLDVATGQRQLWKTLIPPDAAGVYSVIEFQITPDGKSYFYSYTRLLSQLYLVRGLK